jgi:hypothetical protein
MIKKSITRVLACMLALAWATAGAQAPRGPLELTPDAPDRHVVVRGDTLWDISARFLKSPWRWPEIWQLNRDQIANPHLIYPGDIVYLDRSGAQPRLRLGRPVGGADANGAGLATSRLQPSVRASAGEPGAAIPTVNLGAIQVFLSRPLIVDAAGLDTHPRIVATQDGRVHLSQGDLAYVRGLPEAAQADWHVYRPARPLLDPVTREPLAWETLHIGTARLVRTGDPATFRVQVANEEIGEGDRLMPAEAAALPTVAPRPPERPVAGRVLSIHRGVDQVGQHGVVALSVGTREGIEVGHVLEVRLAGREIVDRQTRERVRLPDEPIGQVLVFRVFDRVAYGLVVAAAQPIAIGATVGEP